MSLSLPDRVENLYEARHFIANVDVAACSLFFWDYLITLHLEVDLVWKSGNSYLKYFYIFQRYLPFIDSIILRLHNSLTKGISTNECRVTVVIQWLLMLFGILAAEIILTIRVWTVWDRKPNLGYALVVLYIVFWGMGSGIVIVFVRDLKFEENLPFPGFQGCVMWGTKLPIFVGWIVIFFWNVLLTVMMVIPGVELYRLSGTTNLFKAVYRDAVIYYIYLLILSTVNMVITVALPLEYQDLLISMTRCLHCIFTSRALLHIRSLARNTQPTLSMMTGPLDIALADIKLIEVDSCLQKEEREKSTV